MQSVTIDTQNVHKVFGRDTNIGRMIHKLYNAPKERNCYEPNIKLTLRASDPTKEHKLKLEQMRKEIRSKKKTVRLPKKKKSNKAIPKILLSKGRKSREQIQREMDENNQNIQMPIHIPIRPRCEQIGDLQCLMETGHKKIKIDSVKTGNTRKKKKRCIDAELKHRMEELLNEMNERQKFLDSMRQIKSKNLKQYEAQINVQIAQKCKEFKQIDAFLAAQSKRK